MFGTTPGIVRDTMNVFGIFENVWMSLNMLWKILKRFGTS